MLEEECEEEEFDDSLHVMDAFSTQLQTLRIVTKQYPSYKCEVWRQGLQDGY